ncbi:ferredoxin [Nonomuraea dietziae]|uniref:ferredoxin n=1 Tax=Nonomuraea dietziae TaxID=65515 RepID=UPI0033EF8A33
MKIIVDRVRCAGLGVCESFAPEVFEVNDAGELVLCTGTVPDGLLEDVQHAVESCPSEALRLER